MEKAFEGHNLYDCAIWVYVFEEALVKTWLSTYKPYCSHIHD